MISFVSSEDKVIIKLNFLMHHAHQNSSFKDWTLEGLVNDKMSHLKTLIYLTGRFAEIYIMQLE